MESFKLYISTTGDRSVGIWPMSVEIETRWPDMDDEMRSIYREEFSKALAAIDDTHVQYASFEDECPICLARLKDGLCPGSGCSEYTDTDAANPSTIE